MNLIARTISSLPGAQWVLRKLATPMWRRRHKAPEVQKCVEALKATTPHSEEQRKAFAEYIVALVKEGEKPSRLWP
jgi:hypothetical protein